MFSKTSTTRYTENYSDSIAKLRAALNDAEAVVIGAGAGLSTSAGFTYSGDRLEKYFGDFVRDYHVPDMYSGLEDDEKQSRCDLCMHQLR